MIHTRVEPKRGCGFRKEGGLYLVGGDIMVPCSCLPVRLGVCPVCRHGIKSSRGWTWIQPGALMEPCKAPSCILHRLPERAGLLWVGEKFYPTPHHFLVEGAQMGISRRIQAIPRDFKILETVVLFAHRLTFPDEPRAGIFSAFIPKRIEYVVKKDDTPEKLEALEKRGITLVQIIIKPKELEPELFGIPAEFPL